VEPMILKWDDYTLKEKVEILRYNSKQIDFSMPLIVLIIGVISEIVFLAWFALIFYLFTLIWNYVWDYKKFKYKKIIKARMEL
jgi:hypothetical protein